MAADSSLLIAMLTLLPGCELVGGITGDRDLPGDGATGPSAGVWVEGGWHHTCAILSGGKVRCWSNGEFGRLGYGTTKNLGDDETPASAGDVDVGDTVTQIATGWDHTCALLSGGRARCWGDGTK